MTISKISTVIIDIRGILFTSPPNGFPGVPSNILKDIMSSDIWRQYNCGLFGDKECGAELASRFNLDESEIEEFIQYSREKIALNQDVLNLIVTFQEQYPGHFRTYVLSNISTGDWDVVRNRSRSVWEIFDGIFVSCKIGMSKPELRCFDYLLTRTHTDPSQALFIDTDAENVLAARSIGMKGVIFTGVDSLNQTLSNALGNPVLRGMKFLDRHAKCLHSVTSNGDTIWDNFSQLLIQEAIGDQKGLVMIERHEKTWNYFIGSQNLISGPYPNDMDTTCLALIILKKTPEEGRAVLDEVKKFMTPDGIFMVYFDSQRPRTDPIVCVNILRCFYQYGRGTDPDLQPTKSWVQQTLLYRAYLGGTRYYSSPDVFLFYLSYFVRDNPDAEFCNSLAGLLRDRIRERVQKGGNALELCMRILACQAVGVSVEIDHMRARLLDMQNVDGGWDADWLCRTGKVGTHIGNRGVTTALAVRALAV